EVDVALNVADGGVADHVFDMHIRSLRHDDVNIERLGVGVVLREVEPVMPVPHAVFGIARNHYRTAGRMNRHTVDARLLARDLDGDLRLRLHIYAELADETVDLDVLDVEAAPGTGDPVIVASGGRQDEERSHEGASQNRFPLTGHDRKPSSGRCVPRLHEADM